MHRLWYREKREERREKREGERLEIYSTREWRGLLPSLSPSHLPLAITTRYATLVPKVTTSELV